MTDRFASLPLILAGPTLQHIEPTSVAVWVSLQHPRRVTLRVYETADNGSRVGRLRMQGHRSTIAMGQSMHVVVVMASPLDAVPLEWGQVYAYDLEFEVLPETHTSASSESLQQALCSPSFTDVTVSYFSHQLPTFVLPPDDLASLRLVHGSCRKPHGDGADALAILDDLIATAIATQQPRPQQLFLTGDQIYGDDVADPFLWMAMQLAEELLGWREVLPLQSQSPATVTTEQLPPGQRSHVATNRAGFTAGLLQKSHKVTSHLLSLGEFYAAYLLAWSPVCWTTTFPSGRDYWGRSRQNRAMARLWDQEVRKIQDLIQTLWKVRRAIANVPMYCIFDDHDVSDDWYLNRAWCLRVLGEPLGRRVVQNALLAYTVFQGWGNMPSQFAVGSQGGCLLELAQQWSSSQGTDAVAWEKIRQLLGLPRIDPDTGLPCFQQDGEMLILDRDPDALTWHYTVQSPCHDVIVLDTRTWRGYPIDETPIAPPMLLSPTAFQKELQYPLQHCCDQHEVEYSKITFVIAPTNLFSLQVIDWIQHWHLRHHQVYSSDVGDAWNIRLPALAQLLTTLLNHRESVVVLSGDIHYGGMVKLDYHSTQPSHQRCQLVQAISSSLKNEEFLTRLLQTRLKRWLLPERDRYWVGWHQPMDMQAVPGLPLRSPLADRPPPDWSCQVSWIQPQRSRPAGVDSSKRPSYRYLNPCYQRLGIWLTQPLQQWFQEGAEVIGHNNLGLIQIRSESPQLHYCIIQDLYWRSSSNPLSLVYSRFCASIQRNSLAESSTKRGDI